MIESLRIGAYSPAINVNGERRGEQGTEAVEPGSQEAQTEKEGSRETSRHQNANDKELRMVCAARAYVPQAAGPNGQRPGVQEAMKLEN
jgi:hypothetical protein